MGSYSELYLGSLLLGGDKREINPVVMTLFREDDKRVRVTTAGSPEAADYIEPDTLEPEDEVVLVEYVCSAAAARDRLELMGFTAETAARAFHIARRERIASYEESNRVHGEDFFRDPLRVLQELTVDSWKEGLLEIQQRNLKPTYRSDPACSEYRPLLRYMVCDHGLEWYGYPGYDVRHMIRLALDALGDEADLTYDLSDLILGGYYDTADDLTSHAMYLLQEQFESAQRIVVLTEGSTDKWILERSLRLLYPHLDEYFTFMDFEGVRLAGGAGALANLVKAFAGARILNRVVALFDNDTAAAAALRALTNVTLPSNIVALRYPDVPVANSYPTLGPTGVVSMDVNGLAGSIELYLGLDVLVGDDGQLSPVQWRGYDEGVRRYQGEVLHKALLHERFRRKLEACERDAGKIANSDWTGLRRIIDLLRSAFHRTDADTLLQAV